MGENPQTMAKRAKCELVKCDEIKQNESELANIDFEIEPIMVFNFLCILLF